MFSVKKNVLETVALLKAYGVSQIVISPGSRNAPLIQTFSEDSFFQCHVIVDERNAAFYALGIIQSKKEPVVVCCTSGSALLNFAPAVSEAFYQRLPLIVISGDRTQEWIGQMDGQTIPQVGIFATLSKKSVQLPEIKSDTDQWYCNRLINEALIACTANQHGPVHINIPLSEPLFDYSVERLPEVRKIAYNKPKKIVDIKPYIEKWNKSSKRLIILGQMPDSSALVSILEKIVAKTDCVIVAEHLSNCSSSSFVTNVDVLLTVMSEDLKKDFVPDLIITLGGHIVSKKLKHFLRQNKPDQHWAISETEEVVDLFQSLTDIIEVDAIHFLSDLTEEADKSDGRFYHSKWKEISDKIIEPQNIPYSDISVVGAFLRNLPHNVPLHLANSSTVRNVQLYTLDDSIEVFCNRGTNGIESTLPSAIGFASVHKGEVYLIIGDLSFFYGVGALWNMQHIKNLRILLINNGGGGIFHMLPGLNQASSLKQYVAAEHNTSAKNWAIAAGLNYLVAENEIELNKALKLFNSEKSDRSILLEVVTDLSISKQVALDYYTKLKTKI